MHCSHSIQRGCIGSTNAYLYVTKSNRRPTALNATAAPARYAAEETARKAAAVREQLRHQGSKHARQIHEKNIHIAELQQAAAKRAAQHRQESEEQLLLKQQQQWAEELLAPVEQQQELKQQHQYQQHPQQQQQLEQYQQQADRPQRLPLTLRNRQQLFQGSAAAMQQLSNGFHHHHPQQQQQQQQQDLRQQQQQQLPAQTQAGFYQVLQQVEVQARSDDNRQWQKAAYQCRQVLVPAVSGSLQAAAAWRLMTNLAGRQLNRHAQGALGGAAAALVQVSLAHNDTSLLQRLLSSNRRFLIGPRQIRDLISVAAAAGADTDMLTSLLELAPACQLTSRAYFVVALTCVNRKHYQEAQQCCQRLQGMGVKLSPAMVRLQQRARAALKAVAAR